MATKKLLRRVPSSIALAQSIKTCCFIDLDVVGNVSGIPCLVYLSISHTKLLLVCHLTLYDVMSHKPHEGTASVSFVGH